jgi:hypothetical protein
MKKRTIISLLGIWVALVPLLGLPTTWKKYILILTGLIITVIASTRKKKMALEQSKMSQQ